MSDLGPHGLKPTRLLWHGIPQVRTLEWVAMQASQLRDRTRISYAACVDRRALYHWSRLGSPGLEVTHPPPLWISSGSTEKPLLSPWGYLVPLSNMSFQSFLLLNFIDLHTVSGRILHVCSFAQAYLTLL